MLKFLSKSKERLKKISLKTFCQKSDFFSFSLPAMAAAHVFSHSVFSLLSLHGSNGLSPQHCYLHPTTLVAVPISEIQCKRSEITRTMHSLSRKATINSWLLHSMHWELVTRASQPGPQGTGVVQHLSFTIGLGDPCSAASQSRLFGMASRQ